jgi:Flp pilus assembly protein TadD
VSAVKRVPGAVVSASILAAALALPACAGYTHTEKAKSQIAFGSEVARKGLWREATFRFEQAVAKEPNNARAHNNLAVALEASGEYARALGEYKKALELQPNDNYIRRNYARFAEFYTSYTRTSGKAPSGS